MTTLNCGNGQRQGRPPASPRRTSRGPRSSAPTAHSTAALRAEAKVAARVVKRLSSHRRARSAHDPPFGVLPRGGVALRLVPGELLGSAKEVAQCCEVAADGAKGAGLDEDVP